MQADLKMTADGRAIAMNNPGKVLEWVDELAPQVVGSSDQFAVVTVLKAGGGYGDIACYEALVPATKGWRERVPSQLADICREGRKLSEKRARLVFPDLDTFGTYRR